jgi:hypothetical protein
MRRILPIVAAMALSAGCQQRTELLVGIITDIAAPQPLEVAHLQVFPNGDISQPSRLDTTWMLEPGFDKLPGSFGLNSADGTATTVEILLTGEAPGPTGDYVPFVTRKSRVTLVAGKVLFLRMALVGACMNRTDCLSDETCREGVCVKELVDATTLPDYTPPLVAAVTCGSASFRATDSGQQLRATGQDAPCTGQCIEGTCYLPAGGSTATDNPNPKPPL